MLLVYRVILYWSTGINKKMMGDSEVRLYYTINSIIPGIVFIDYGVTVNSVGSVLLS